MRYKGTLIAVKDMERAKRFYGDVMGLDVVMDAGANVELTGGVFLQTATTWATFIRKPEEDITFVNNAVELYFETDDIDGFAEKLATVADIVYVHPLLEHSWGQRAVRFYDADGHILEVAENMVTVTQRWIDGGLTIEQAAARMDADVAYVAALLAQA